MKLPEGKTRLDLVKEGLVEGGVKKQGRLIVSITRLREDPKNERRTFREMEGLVASIKSVGLVEPLTVTPVVEENGTGAGETVYRIVTGHRRYRAARKAGLTEVEVLIREPDDETRRRLKSIVSNVQREDIGPVEMAEALQSLLDDQQVKSQRDLAAAIGKDESWVSRMRRILSLPELQKGRLASTQVSVSYDSVAEIARLKQEDDQVRLIDAVLSGTPQAQIREQIRQLKGTSVKPGSSQSQAAAKPKRVFHTNFKATIIVQSTTTRLTGDQVVAALKEAIEQATEATTRSRRTKTAAQRSRGNPFVSGNPTLHDVRDLNLPSD